MEGNVGSLGLASLIYIVYTTCSCVLISMCMHLIIRPGHAYVTTAGATEVDALSHDQSYEDLWFDILRYSHSRVHMFVLPDAAAVWNVMVT